MATIRDYGRAGPQSTLYGIDPANIAAALTAKNWLRKAVVRIHPQGGLYIWIQPAEEAGRRFYAVQVYGRFKGASGYAEDFDALADALAYVNGEAGRLAEETRPGTTFDRPRLDPPGWTIITGANVNTKRGPDTPSFDAAEPPTITGRLEGTEVREREGNGSEIARRPQSERRRWRPAVSYYLAPPEIPQEVVDRILEHYEATGRPLLEYGPADSYHTLIHAQENGAGGYTLSDPAYEEPNPPVMTWREYAERVCGVAPEQYEEEYGERIEEWDALADPARVAEWWAENEPPSETPSGAVYYMLEGLDIGVDEDDLEPVDDFGPDPVLGGLSFFNGPYPGNDWTGVEVSSAPALAALQWRLDQLGAGMRIDVVT